MNIHTGAPGLHTFLASYSHSATQRVQERWSLASPSKGEAKEMQDRIMGGDCHSYEEALGIISEYVETELSGSIPAKNKNKEDHTHER